jgi:hypothetical protein
MPGSIPKYLIDVEVAERRFEDRREPERIATFRTSLVSAILAAAVAVSGSIISILIQPK